MKLSCVGFNFSCSLSYDDKFILELRAITNLDIREIVKNLDLLNSSNNNIKYYFLANGKFPSKIEDEFMCDFGFEELQIASNQIKENFNKY
jgi:hypothetical protein